MRRSMIGIVLLLSVAGTALGEDRTDAELAAAARRAFESGIASKARFLEARKHFSQAADVWLELHKRGVRGAGLYRNLGNAAALAERWPQAIWAYHMGLTIDPNDHPMREHLAFARAKTIYPASGVGKLDKDAWPDWLYRPCASNLAWLAAIAYLFAWIMGAITFIRRTRRAMLATAAASGLAFALAAGWWQASDQAAYDRSNPLVILADNTPFLRGNGPSYPPHPDLPLLPRGMEVRQIHRRGNWLQVRLSTGEIGWIPAARALIVQIE